MNIRSALLMSVILLLAACSTVRSGGGYLPGDGPGVINMAKVHAAHNAVPRDEPLHAAANRPYEVQGVHYVPLSQPGHYKERGWASWYGIKFNGHKTSSGEVYDMYAMTAAHKTLPIPSYARVTNLRNHKSVIVRINDRGPFVRDRIIDLSYSAAYKLGIVKNGSEEVEVESIVPGQTEPAARPASSDAEPVQVKTLPPASLPPATPPHQAAAAADSGGSYYVQLGSFHSRYGAERFMAHMRRKVAGTGKSLSMSRSGRLTRVRLGPYRSSNAAHAAAERLGPRLGLKPFVTTR